MATTRGRSTVVAALALTLLVVGCGQEGTTAQPGSGAGGPGTTAGDLPGPSGTIPSEPPTAEPTEDGMTDDTRSPEPLEPPTVLPGVVELPADPAGAELVLVVEGPDGDQPPVVLSCDWAGGTVSGDHPQAEQACADLLAAVRTGNPFAPVPPDSMCTQIFGGEAVVRVSGAVLAADGGPVDVQARFALNDGCEIDRWQGMGAVLSPYGGAAR